MKAIHNVQKLGTITIPAVNYTQRYKKWKQFTTQLSWAILVQQLWTIHKDTKNESNSQLPWGFGYVSKCCELYTKIQKMKAIHNGNVYTIHLPRAVNYTQRYKKWKQFTTNLVTSLCALSCELYTKIQKMKAILHMARWRLARHGAVNYTQRYKKWKQFTTAS